MGNVVNRVFDSSGPEGKVRGTPQQIIDKYNQLARDAQLAGDRVNTENFQQHAEHYLRMLSVAQKEQDARREEQERQNRERQAERDRDRAKRQERESNGGEMVDSAPNDGTGEQPVIASDDDSGLVETPEASHDKPKRQRKPRKPRNDEADMGEQPSSEPDDDAGSQAAAE